MFAIENASFGYHSDLNIFTDSSFSVKKGEILCILGPNGIGKSTLLKCCAGIMPIVSGEIFVAGTNVKEYSRRELAKKIAYVPQAHHIVFPFTVFQLVLLGRTPHIATYARPGKRDYDIALSTLEIVGIAHLKEAPVNKISGGECQLAMIARALAQEPSVLILDEPTSHLDFGNQVRILHILQQLGQRKQISIIMSTHYPDHTFLLASRVGIMHNGSVSLVDEAEKVVTEQSLRNTYQITVGVHFIEKEGRCVCVPSYP